MTAHDQPLLDAGVRIDNLPAEGRWIDVVATPDQRRAIGAALALAQGELLLIQGPPGTGKTSTIAELAQAIVRRRASGRGRACRRRTARAGPRHRDPGTGRF